MKKSVSEYRNDNNNSNNNNTNLNLTSGRGLFTSDTSRSSRPSTNDACVPYVASNGLVSDLEVLQRCKLISIETNIRHRQLRWCGHIAGCGPKTPKAAALRRAQNREETPRKTP